MTLEMVNLHTPGAVGLRGDMAPLSWDKTLKMTDPDQNGVFEATVVVESAESNFLLRYKYIHDHATVETIDNRVVWVKNKQSVLPLDRWNVPAMVNDLERYEQDGAVKLQQTIVSLDSSLFSTLYTCNPQRNRSFLMEDMEFYENQKGVLKGRKAFMESLEKKYCAGFQNFKLHREVIRGSMKVDRLPGFGAIQTGEQRYFHVAGDRKGPPVGTSKFTHIWHEMPNGEWRISRIILYDRREYK